MEPDGRPLILVVDDDATIRNLVTTILGQHGMEVAAAANGDEALTFIEQRRPDVMLLDLAMPRVDGLEVLRRVREHPTLGNLHVVILTATANTARFQAVQSYRPDSHIEKPFRVNDLVNHVKKALSQQGR